MSLRIRGRRGSPVDDESFQLQNCRRRRQGHGRQGRPRRCENPPQRILINSGTAPWPLDSPDRRALAGDCRAIDRGLDRALLGLRPHWPNAAMGDKALTDLVAVVDQMIEKIKRARIEDAYDRRRLHALWPSNHYHRCLGMILTYGRYQRTFNSVLMLALLNSGIVVSS